MNGMRNIVGQKIDLKTISIANFLASSANSEKSPDLSNVEEYRR